MRQALVLVTIALAAGICIGNAVHPPVAAVTLVALSMALLAAAARAAGRNVGVGLLGLAAALGGLAERAAHPPVPVGLLDGEPWRIDGVVADQLERGSDGSTHLPVELEAVERDAARRLVTGRILVTLGGEPHEPLLPGDHVRFAARLRPPRGLVNDGAPDGARRVAAEGAVALASVHDAAALCRLDVEPRWSWRRPLAAWRDRLRAAMLAGLADDSPGGGERRALLLALVLGDRAGVGAPLEEQFRRAGVSHVLSVSGLHLALAALLFHVGLTHVLLRVPGLARGRPVERIAACFALPATIAYTVITGAAVATVRACLVAVLWLGACALGRSIGAVSALVLSTALLLLASPLDLFDPSFQLSVAAAVGTALLAPRLLAPLGPRLQSWPLIAPAMVRLLAASLAALVCTAPITAYHFGDAAGAGLVANLFVVPITELGLVPCGLVGALIGTIAPALGHAVLFLAAQGTRLLIFLVRLTASATPGIGLRAPTTLELLAWFVPLGCLFAGVKRWRAVAAVGALLLLLSVVGQRAAFRLSRTLRAHFLDVGQGDAAILELPGGHVVVIDGGGSFDSAYDPGTRVLVPWLRRRGISRLDLVVLSHPHPDHANGLAALVDAFSVGEVWTGGDETAQPGTLRLLAAAARRGVAVRRPHALELGGVAIEALHPHDAGEGGVGIHADPALSENDNSVVLTLAWGGRRLLFAGDIERQAEEQLLAAGAPLRADVVKVPHHGSRTSSTRPFVWAVAPEIAVVSVGAGNRWGFPNPAVLARYRGVGARVLRTDWHGEVTVSITGTGTLDWDTARPDDDL